MDIRLVDTNIDDLEDCYFHWADVAMFSAMNIQENSLNHLLERASRFELIRIVGGPLVTTSLTPFDADVIVKGEVEPVIEAFIADIEANTLSPVYESTERPCLWKAG